MVDKIEACGVVIGLPALLGVAHIQLEMLRRILGAPCGDVAHARHLVASIAAVSLVGVEWGARARRRVTSVAWRLPLCDNLDRVRHALPWGAGLVVDAVLHVAQRRPKRAWVHVLEAGTVCDDARGTRRLHVRGRPIRRHSGCAWPCACAPAAPLSLHQMDGCCPSWHCMDGWMVGIYRGGAGLWTRYARAVVVRPRARILHIAAGRGPRI